MSEQPENYGWFRSMRNPAGPELAKASGDAFILAYFIAFRARYNVGFNALQLEPGEALLGDFEAYGMTKSRYRTAKKNLTEWGFATFKSTPNGTIAKLTDARVFSVFKTEVDTQHSTRVAHGSHTGRTPLAPNKIRRTEEQKNDQEKKGGSPPQGWKLVKDRERLQKQIREIAESTSPDRQLLSGLRAELKIINGKLRAAAPIPEPGPVSNEPDIKVSSMTAAQRAQWKKLAAEMEVAVTAIKVNTPTLKEPEVCATVVPESEALKGTPKAPAPGPAPFQPPTPGEAWETVSKAQMGFTRAEVTEAWGRLQNAGWPNKTTPWSTQLVTTIMRTRT